MNTLDTFLIFHQILINYWWLIPLPFLVVILKSPFVKGIFGEWLVNVAIRFFLDKKEYHLFKNVTLPTEDGTTQIDHVIVSRYGVFVIETKNMRGWIFGSSNQKTWTQKIYRHTNKFQNPLHQNYKHTHTLQTALELDLDKIFSLVVFVGDSNFKSPMPNNVVYGYDCIRLIKSKTIPVLTTSEVQAVCSRIESGRLKISFKTHREHVRHVRTIVEKKRQPVVENACPECGKPMVLRTAKRGTNQGKQFGGCSGYPKCRTVRQMT